MRHDSMCEQPDQRGCRCAERAYLATASPEERAAFRKANPELSGSLQPPTRRT